MKSPSSGFWCPLLLLRTSLCSVLTQALQVLNAQLFKQQMGDLLRGDTERPPFRRLWEFFVVIAGSASDTEIHVSTFFPCSRADGAHSYARVHAPCNVRDSAQQANLHRGRRNIAMCVCHAASKHTQEQDQPCNACSAHNQPTYYLTTACADTCSKAPASGAGPSGAHLRLRAAVWWGCTTPTEPTVSSMQSSPCCSTCLSSCAHASKQCSMLMDCQGHWVVSLPWYQVSTRCLIAVR